VLFTCEVIHYLLSNPFFLFQVMILTNPSCHFVFLFQQQQALPLSLLSSILFDDSSHLKRFRLILLLFI
jgi:hypothetical protein